MERKGDGAKGRWSERAMERKGEGAMRIEFFDFISAIAQDQFG
jgi:hypothetical protein